MDKLKAFESFVSVATRGSLTAAARAEGVAPAIMGRRLDALGVPARELLFVSSNGWDAIGATWFGFTTLWVNRAGAPLEALGTAPTAQGTSLRDVLNFFPA